MLRKVANLLLLTVSLVLPSLTSPFLSRTDVFAAEKQDCTVYVTRTGHRYHRAGCRYLRRGSIAISREKALSRGLTPCSVCGGSDCEKE